MSIRVLIVDDSSFFCSQLNKLLTLEPEFNVVGIARNGNEAVKMAETLRPDVITMDVEMPVMDGITATRAIMAKTPTPILMLSSLTYEGARLTLDALDSGAVDFYLKSYEALTDPRSSASARLRAKVRAVARANIPGRTSQIGKVSDGHEVLASPPMDTMRQSQKELLREPRIILMGASTGGPIALQHVICGLPASLPVPVVVVQHMPEGFTRAFAHRLDRLAGLKVKEASDGEPLRAGCVYVAPGGKQTYFGRQESPVIRIAPPDPRVNYQPCVDVTFASAARIFGSDVLGIVYTGMGSDGKEGARKLKQAGAEIWVQDESSCVVYGMPMAVVQAGLADKQMSLDAMREAIRRIWDET